MMMRDPFEDMFALRNRMLEGFGFGIMDPFHDDDFFGNRRRNNFDDFGFHNMMDLDNFP